MQKQPRPLSPGAEIIDNLKAARGAHEGFGDLAGFSIGQLANLSSGSASLEGANLTVKGEAPTVEAYETVTTAVNGDLPGSGVLALADITGPTADPYTFTATKSDDGIVLDGYVPSNAVRSQVVAAAEEAAESKSVTDNLQLALGAPDGFGETAAFGVSQLAGMSAGTTGMNGPDLSVKGDAKSVEDFEAIENALKNQLPSGANLAMDEVTSPAISPYPFSAVETDSGVVLSGFVPDEETRAAMIAAAGETTDGVVTDRLEIGPGASPGFADLAGFGIARLGEFSSGTVNLSDLDLSVRGTAISPESYDAATSALSGEIPAGGKVAIADITRSTVSPYTFSAAKDDGIVVLEGYVASEQEKAEAETFAKTLNPADRIINRLIVANGVPDNVSWPEASKLAVTNASRLIKGTSALEDGMYSVEGMAKSNADFDKLKSSANGTLPAGLKLAKEDVRRPVITPYVWSFTNMEGAAPALSGYVPDEDLASQNIEQVEARIGTAQPVASSLEIGAGAPANLGSASSVGIQAASRLFNGKAEITGNELMVSGEALSEQAAAQIRTNVENGVPPGFSGKHNITVREVLALPTLAPDECQNLLTEGLRHNSIRFETDKSVIREDSFGLLDRLAFVVKRCPTADVEIEGHTDSDGSEDYNQGLSEDRANAVRSYLVRNGIFVGRLQAAGFGEKNPIADNSTAEGKAQNRRIEFTVIR